MPTRGFRASDRPGALWVALAAAVLLVSGYALARSNGFFTREAAEMAGPPTPPQEATDPSNPAVLIETGRAARYRRDPNAETVGPRSTAGEGMPTAVVPAFWMQQHEVTNEEFQRYDSLHRFPEGQERYPVAEVTWLEAMGYAVSVSGSLPTEAQWEFAARGTEGRRYPWGNLAPTCERAQFRDCEPRGAIEVTTRPHGATPAGIHDLAGNVWEWVTPNWFVPFKTPVNNESRRLRGGSFDDDAFFLRTTNRNNDFFKGFKYASVGFRVVWALTEEE